MAASSELIHAVRMRANKLIMQGVRSENIDLLEIAHDVVNESCAELTLRDIIYARASSLFQYRSLLDAAASEIRAASGHRKCLFEAGLAEASRLNSSMHDIFSIWLKSNDVETIGSDQPDIAAGAAVELMSYISIHATACLVGLEVLALTRIGSIDGARARCRAMHEANVIAVTLLRGRGSSASLADRWHLSAELRHARYLRHSATERAEDRPDLAQVATDAEKDVEWILRKFPGLDRGDYEWARPIFPTHRSGQRITFRDLETYSELYFRGRYMQLSDSVHLSPYRIVRGADSMLHDLYSTIPRLNWKDDADIVKLAHLQLYTITQTVFSQICFITKEFDELYELGATKILWDAHDALTE